MTSYVGSGHQRLVSQRSSVHDPFQGISEDMRVFPVVESPLQFLKVAVQVLPAHLVEGADNGPLEQAPHALDPVGVDLTDNPLFGRMAHSPVYGVLILDPDVGLQFIGVNRFSLILNGSMDEIVQGVTLDIRNALYSNLTAIPLDGPGDPSLVAFGAATYQCFVYFNDAKERGAGEGIVAHRLSDTVAQIPGSLVGDSQGPVKLISTHTLFRLAHEVGGCEPLPQGQVGVVHHCARGDGEMVATPLAVPLPTPLDSSHCSIAAPDAGHAIRPAQTFQMLAAFVIIIETIKQREDIHESSS